MHQGDSRVTLPQFSFKTPPPRSTPPKTPNHSFMAATSTSDAQSPEGPVLTFLNKRIRALRKKLTRILQMEDSLAQGKSLNSEQQEVFRSKSGVLAVIDELEKLRSPLSSVVSDEISIALQKHIPAPPLEPSSDASEDLLNLLYFGNLFDVVPQTDFTSVMLTKTHERGCCLTYDYVTDDATDDLLAEKDLDLISDLKGLVVSRPVSSGLSHKDALRRCAEHAKLWIEKSDQPIQPHSNVTYVGLREKLSKIMSSDYYTATPEMRGPVEMAAAAGVATFGSFQVPLQGGSVSESVVEYNQEGVNKEENPNIEECEITGEHQSIPLEEETLQKDNLENGNSTEEVSIQAADEEKALTKDEQKQGDADSTGQQQFMPHRHHYQNNPRGGGGRGGRRGYYSNGRGGRGSGRGGGSYQNGPGQYYEQGGSNYYPRNNYRGRGGGGGRGYNGGGNSYYYQSSDMQGSHPQSNVGVAS